jgi:hypothetical protein
MELKQRARFENNWKRMVAVTSDPSPEKQGKVQESEVVQIFAEIKKERDEKARAEFKTELSAVLQAKIDLDKSIRNGRKELDKKEEKEYETLNKVMDDAFNKLERVKQEGNKLVSEASGDFKPEEETRDQNEEDNTSKEK